MRLIARGIDTVLRQEVSAMRAYVRVRPLTDDEYQLVVSQGTDAHIRTHG